MYMSHIFRNCTSRKSVFLNILPTNYSNMLKCVNNSWQKTKWVRKWFLTVSNCYIAKESVKKTNRWKQNINLACRKAWVLLKSLVLILTFDKPNRTFMLTRSQIISSTRSELQRTKNIFPPIQRQRQS